MRRSRRWVALLGLVVVGGCAARSETAPDHHQVVDVLLRSAQAWNRGDLDGFVDPYERSERTTFVGGRGFHRGFDELRDGYIRGYWADGSPRDSLAFDVADVRPLDQDAALLLGRYILLDRSTGSTTSTGVFSLVFVRTADGWKITHDHTSETP